MASDDPDFEEKAADVIGLYLKPPMHAAVFCVDSALNTQTGEVLAKTMRYIRNYNKTATPVRWIYKNVAHTIRPNAK
jgi:hypothetical protein